MDDLAALFGSLVAAHRRQKGLTQDELASRSQLSVETVGKIERGKVGPTLETIGKIASALDVEAAQLFTTDLPNNALRRPELTQITATLAGLSDGDLAWIRGIIDAALRPRRSG